LELHQAELPSNMQYMYGIR